MDTGGYALVDELIGQAQSEYGKSFSDLNPVEQWALLQSRESDPLELPEDCIEAWEPDADFPGIAHLRREGASFRINGYGLHVAAFRVEDDAQGLQVSWQGCFEDEVDALQTFAQGRLATTKLPGLEGDWILSATPFGA